MHAVKPETRTFYLRAVSAAVERIAGGLDDALELHGLARAVGLSPFHFHRIFRGMVGETPLELTRRLRMERAAWRLLETDRAITEIAFEAGYETHEAFTRAFRACYSTSPTGFRRRPLARIELAAGSGVHFDPDGGPVAFEPRQTGGRDMKVEIEDLPEQRLATVRHVGPYNLIGSAFAELGALAGPSGLIDPGRSQMVALYHDDPESTPLAELRADAGVTVAEDIDLPRGLAEQRLPAGRYARTVHAGSYTRLGDTWARFLGEWLPSSGRRLGDQPSFEVYRNTPATVADEAELETELYVLLEPTDPEA